MPKTCAVFIPIFTTLKDWEETGILNRELFIYQEHHLTFGTRFLIFTCGDEEDRKYESQFKGLTIIPLNVKSPLDFIKALLNAPFKYKSEFKSVDLIKVDQMWSTWLGLWYSLVKGKKLWARMGYEHYQLQCAQGTHVIKRWIVFLLSFFTYKRAFFITVTTQNIKDFIIKTFSISPENIHVRANYIDTRLFKRTNEPNVTDRILFIGRIDVVKNLKGIIKGCKQANLALDIVGKGPIKDEIENYAKELQVSVNFLGVVPNQKLPKLMEEYRYFILASFHEGNPKSLLEAMSMECLCIATDVPGIRGVIKNDHNGILCQTDGDSIGKALIKAKTADGAIQKNARQYILENNSLEKLIAFENELICKQ